MEVTRKRRKDKRSRSVISSRTSTPELNLTTAEKSHYDTGFPPGITVDELFHFRKKKPPAFVQIQDNLRLEEGSFREIKSEYKRRFRDDIYKNILVLERIKAKRPEDSLKVGGFLELNPEYYETFVEYPIENSITNRRERVLNPLDMEIENEADNTDTEHEEEDQEKEDKLRLRLRRHYLFRRPTNLKLEGDFCAESESAEKFIEYLLTGRPNLTRRPTTLKLEGDMDTKTENREKYVPLDCQARPALLRKSTNLHLEGVIDITTETKEKYLPFNLQKRTPLTKQSTNLHLEGDLKLKPEYKEAYVEYKDPERPKLKLPVNNLRTEGGFEMQTEKSEKFVEHQIHPVIPFLRGSGLPGRKLTLGDDPIVKRAEYKEKFVEYPKAERSMRHNPENHLKPEGNMEILTESRTQFVQKPVNRTETKRMANNLLLEGNIDMKPEYRNAYVNFYKDAYGKFGVKKDSDSPEKRRRRSVSHPGTNLKIEGELEANPEYKSAFVDFPRNRPSVRKPNNLLQRSEGNLSNITEKRAQFIEHPKPSKLKPLKRQTQLKLEGPFECQPEYRRAYIDYITREKAEKLRPLDNLGEQSRRVFEESETLMPMIKPENVPVAEVSLLPDIKGKPPLPTSSKKLSSPNPAKKKINKENLSKMETCLFGPKVPTPINRSQEERARRSRRRYGSPVMVENLAYTSSTSPVPALLEASNSGCWKPKDDDDDRAFVVLGNVESGHHKYRNDSRDRESVRRNELYKEQKWMPSWYAPTSK